METLLLCNYNFHQVLPIPNSLVFKKPISPRSSFNQVRFFSSSNHSSTTRTLKMAQTTQNPGNEIHHCTRTYLYIYVYVHKCMSLYFCVCDQVYVRETNREIERDLLANNSKFVDLDYKRYIICEAHFVTDGFFFFFFWVCFCFMQ